MVWRFYNYPSWLLLTKSNMYATVDELLSWMRLVGDDAIPNQDEIIERDQLLEEVIIGSTKTLNACCRRTFTTHNNITRFYYTSEYRQARKIRVDDIRSVTELLVDGVAVTGYRLETQPIQNMGDPVNYIYANGRWPRNAELSITGNYGWSAVPADIHLACMRLSAEYYKRGSNQDDIGVDGTVILRRLAHSGMLRALWKNYQIVAMA